MTVNFIIFKKWVVRKSKKLWEKSTENSPDRSTTNTKPSSPSSENLKLLLRSSRSGTHWISKPRKISRRFMKRRNSSLMKIFPLLRPSREPRRQKNRLMNLPGILSQDIPLLFLTILQPKSSVATREELKEIHLTLTVDLNNVMTADWILNLPLFNLNINQSPNTHNLTILLFSNITMKSLVGNTLVGYLNKFQKWSNYFGWRRKILRRALKKLRTEELELTNLLVEEDTSERLEILTVLQLRFFGEDLLRREEFTGIIYLVKSRLITHPNKE
jgi:hypothetical protein